MIPTSDRDRHYSSVRDRHPQRIRVRPHILRLDHCLYDNNVLVSVGWLYDHALLCSLWDLVRTYTGLLPSFTEYYPSTSCSRPPKSAWTADGIHWCDPSLPPQPTTGRRTADPLFHHSTGGVHNIHREHGSIHVRFAHAFSTRACPGLAQRPRTGRGASSTPSRTARSRPSKPSARGASPSSSA